MYAQWYLREDRNWLFLGGIAAFDGFRLESPDGSKTNLFAAYVSPRIGLRIPLGTDLLFFEPSFGAALRVWDSSLGDTKATVRAQPVAPISFLSIGGAIPL